MPQSPRAYLASKVTKPRYISSLPKMTFQLERQRTPDNARQVPPADPGFKLQ